MVVAPVVDRAFAGNNPYYSPEKCGLTLVADMDDPNCSYDFEMLVLWRDNASGQFYLAYDSGCSCPTPFEEMTQLSALQLVSMLDEIKAVIAEHNTYNRWPAQCCEKFLETARIGMGL